MPLFGDVGFINLNIAAIPAAQVTQQQGTKTGSEKKEEKIDYSKPLNLSSLSGKLVAPADDDAFNNPARYTPELAASNERIIRDRMTKAGIDKDEIDRWIWNFKEESELQNKREKYTPLPGAPEKGIAERRKFYFDNKHLFYFRVDDKGTRIPGSIARIPKDGKLPSNGRLFPGSQISGGGAYYGRTPLQLTGDMNYKSIGDAIGIDLVSNPDLVFDDRVWPEVVIAYRAQKAREGHKFDTMDGVIKAIGPAKEKAAQRRAKAASEGRK